MSEAWYEMSDTDRETIILLENVDKFFGDFQALKDVRLSVKTGERVVVCGPSGSGKSTLIRCINRLEEHNSGKIVVNGHELTGDVADIDAVRSEVGMVFQNFNLIDELTVYENVELPLLYLFFPAADRKDRVGAALEHMQIPHRSSHFPQQLSGGQQQRVAVARAVIGNPKLILADEPTGNLDSANGSEVMQLLTGLNEAGTTIVMVTHDQAQAGYAHRTINLFDGRIVTENMHTEVQAPAQD